MIGIIKNDLINIRKTTLISLFIIFFSQLGIIIPVILGKSEPSSSLFMVMILYLVFSSVGNIVIDMDEKSGMKTLSKTFPITNAEYMTAKYKSTLIVEIFILIINSLVIYLSYKSIGAINISINLFLVFAIYSFISMPIHLKYKNKALPIIIAVSFMIYVLYMNFKSGFGLVEKFFLNMNISLQAVLGLLFIVTYILTKKISIKILEENIE